MARGFLGYAVDCCWCERRGRCWGEGEGVVVVDVGSGGLSGGISISDCSCIWIGGVI